MIFSIKDEITATLGIEPALLIAHLIAIIVIFLLIYFFVWKKASGFLEKRESKIRNNLQSAQKAIRDAYKNKEKMEKDLTQASIRATEIIGKAHVDGNIKREEIIKKATSDAENLITNAKIMIAAEKNHQRNLLRQEAIDAAFQMSEKLLKREVSEKDHEDLIKSFISDIKASNEE